MTASSRLGTHGQESRKVRGTQGNECAYCARSPSRENTLLVVCDKCERAVYCSSDCKTADRKKHMVQCRMWEIGRKHRVDAYQEPLQPLFLGVTNQHFHHRRLTEPTQSVVVMGEEEGDMPRAESPQRSLRRAVPGQFDDTRPGDSSVPKTISVPHYVWKPPEPDDSMALLEQKLGSLCLAEVTIDSPFPCWSAAIEWLHRMDTLRVPRSLIVRDPPGTRDRCEEFILQCWERHLELCVNSWTAAQETAFSLSESTTTCENLWRQLRIVLLHGSVAFVILKGCDKSDKTPEAFFGPLIMMLDLKGQADALECIAHECAAIHVMQARRFCADLALNPVSLGWVFEYGMDNVQLSYWQGVSLQSARAALDRGKSDSQVFPVRRARAPDKTLIVTEAEIGPGYTTEPAATQHVFRVPLFATCQCCCTVFNRVQAAVRHGKPEPPRPSDNNTVR
jgi:MYND finger